MSESHCICLLVGRKFGHGCHIFFPPPQPNEKILYYYFFSLYPPIVYLKQTLGVELDKNERLFIVALSDIQCCLFSL